jgi:hypothetical protein
LRLYYDKDGILVQKLYLLFFLFLNMLMLSNEDVFFFFVGLAFSALFGVVGNFYVSDYYRYIDSKNPVRNNYIDRKEKLKRWNRSKSAAMLIAGAYAITLSFVYLQLNPIWWLLLVLILIIYCIVSYYE